MHWPRHAKTRLALDRKRRSRIGVWENPSAYIYLSVDSSEEAERVYKLLAEDGQIYMPLEETIFATRFSQLRDRFGVSWSIIHERTKSTLHVEYELDDHMVCCPMTTKIKNYPFEVVISSANPSAVLADQLKRLDWRRIRAKRKGAISADELAEVRAKIRADRLS
jgi:PemK-like, MazF-like toxin of type II toxin-antitoxin system/3-demethylubiquinone-9 3-methyltransferase